MTTPAPLAERIGEVPVRVPETELMCSSSCGCPHEEWEYRGATFALHQDEGLPVQTFVLVDEGEELELPDAESFELAREQARTWIDARFSAEGSDQ